MSSSLSSTAKQTQPIPVMNLERSVLSTSLPTAVGASAFITEPRNEATFTLLSRPQQNITGVNTSLILPSAPNLDSFQSSSLSGPQQSSHIPSTGAVQGRAARNDYFDTEDPSVNLHDFIINSMQSQKNRVILIKLEEEFVAYIQDVGHVGPLKLPPWDSYHRMLAHRVAAYFGLEHNVDPLDKMCVLVQKGPNTRLPQRRFGECMSIHQDESETSEPKLILKRAVKEGPDVTKLESLLASSSEYSSLKSLKTFEEREEEYERARARIFSQQSPLESRDPSVMFDLETPSTTTRRKSRILPAIMQHRRAASDTTAFLFNRVAMSELLKDGPSSDHSSRSMTPLFSSLNKSAEAISHPFGSHHKLDQSPKKQVSPHTQQKASQFESHNAVVPVSPPKFTKSVPDYDPPVPEDSGESTTISQRNYQAVQNAVPVVYHQPGTVVGDPNWYPYQQMMVYQVPPHGYVPAAHYGSFAHQMIPPGQLVAINPAYQPLTPGGLAQPTVIAPAKDHHIPQQVRHVPGVQDTMEQFPTTTHPAGYALVRPIPQQASPIRVPAKGFGPWGSPMSQSYAVPQPVMLQQHSDQAAFTTLVPLTQDIHSSRLADQVEKSLHITDSSLQEMTPNQMNQVTNDSRKLFPATTSMLTDNQSRFNVGASISSPGRFIGTSMAMVGNSSHVGGNGLYTLSNKSIGPVGSVEQNFVGGNIVSPTLPRGPVQFFPQPVHAHMFGGGHEAAYVGGAGGLPVSQGSMARYPSGFSPQASSPAQPSTPPVGALNLPPGVLQAHPQAVFSPSSAGITHSPVQILGHTLGTSLFSPPPSTTCTSHAAGFGQSYSPSGKLMGVGTEAPPHPPIGTGAIPDSPVLVQSSYSLTRSNNTSHGGNVVQSVPLPPRLSTQNRQQRSGTNRYQNQRHPANRPNKSGAQDMSMNLAGSVPISDQVPSHVMSTAMKKEALLPTPPSHQIVKLDTSLTCGVPLNVMELVNFPPDGSSEMHSAAQTLLEIGVKETKSGVMSKTGERVMIAVFENSESAVKALQVKHPHFVLSIPRNNHARFILTLLHSEN